MPPTAPRSMKTASPLGQLVFTHKLDCWKQGVAQVFWSAVACYRFLVPNCLAPACWRSKFGVVAAAIHDGRSPVGRYDGSKLPWRKLDAI